MKISAKGQYAVRLMLDVAKSENSISINSVAKAQGISSKYLEQIVSKLVKANLLESSRGSSGGYKLTKSPNEISVKDILEVTGDTCTLAPCVNGNCERKHICVAKNVWTKLGNLIDDYLDSVTLQTLINN